MGGQDRVRMDIRGEERGEDKGGIKGWRYGTAGG